MNHYSIFLLVQSNPNDTVTVVDYCMLHAILKQFKIMVSPAHISHNFINYCAAIYHDWLLLISMEFGILINLSVCTEGKHSPSPTSMTVVLDTLISRLYPLTIEPAVLIIILSPDLVTSVFLMTIAAIRSQI